MSQPTGVKHDAGKVPLDLIDREALIQLGRVLEYGATKYSANNWRGGLQWSRTIAAALRHIQAFNDGEDVDPETGISHMAHAMCNCMFLLNFIKNRGDLDDRYTTIKKQEVQHALEGGIKISQAAVNADIDQRNRPLASWSK